MTSTYADSFGIKKCAVTPAKSKSNNEGIKNSILL